MKAVRVVLVADTHLGFDLPLRPRVERRRRGNDFFANYHRVLDHVVRTRPQAFVHGGDFFFRSRVAPEIADRAYTALAVIADLGVPVVVVPGNHDRSRLPSSIWLAHRNIHVLDRPRTMLIDAHDMRLAIGGFPFARGDIRASLPRLLQQTGIERADAGIRLLCMHQTVAGARVGPNGFEFRSGPDVVRPSSLPRTLTAVLAGHIHRAQVLEAGDGPPVIYAGSIERTSFAERNEPKGFFDLTFAAGRARAAFVAEATFVALPTRPMLDLNVPHDVAPEDLGPFLVRASRGCHPDAVVRITAADHADPRVTHQLTAPFLRSLFPPTTNVQLSRSLFDAVR